jgi:transposase
MSIMPQKRILVPLLGFSAISGNIRVVMEPRTRVAEIHTTFTLAPPKSVPDGGNAAVDIGQSEVMTDDHGRRYGRKFGPFLQKASRVELDKSRKRQKLHAICKKALESGNHAKARRIKTNNLGFKKMDVRRERNRAECERLVNTAFNEFLKRRGPARFAQEKLDFRGKAKSRSMARRTVQMRNSIINDRSHFKASAAGACRQRANPAYSSQLCPRCGYVHVRVVCEKVCKNSSRKKGPWY